MSEVDVEVVGRPSLVNYTINIQIFYVHNWLRKLKLKLVIIEQAEPSCIIVYSFASSDIISSTCVDSKYSINQPQDAS